MSSSKEEKKDAREARVVFREVLDSKDAKWIRLVKLKYTHPSAPDSKPREYEAAERATRPVPALREGVGLRKEDDATRETVSADSVGIIVIADMPPSTTNTNTPSISGAESHSQAAGTTKQNQKETTTKKPHILLLKQFRPPLDRVCIEIPAGLIDEGESPQDCALRELKEETGYTGSIIPSSTTSTTTSPKDEKNYQYPGLTHFNDPGFTNTATHLIHVRVNLAHADNSNPEAKRRLEENEHLDAFWVPVSELYNECVRLEREEGYAIDARVGTLAEGVEMARQLGAGVLGA